MTTLKRSSSFVFLRHALSEANKDEIVQGQSDYPLAPEGLDQIDALIRFWKSHDSVFDLVISSPLVRASSTAERIAAKFDLTIVYDDIWKERHHGEAQEVPYKQARQWYADRQPASPFEPVFGSGETEWELHIRACRAVQKIMSLDPGSYLVVSHGGFLGSVLRAILGIAPSSGRTPPARFSFANTGFAELRFDPDEARWYIDSLNSSAHL